MDPKGPNRVEMRHRDHSRSFLASCRRRRDRSSPRSGVLGDVRKARRLSSETMMKHSEGNGPLHQDYPVTVGSESRTFRSGPTTILMLFVVATERRPIRALSRLNRARVQNELVHDVKRSGSRRRTIPNWGPADHFRGNSATMLKRTPFSGPLLA
jgi:hypothetical protein